MTSTVFNPNFFEAPAGAVEADDLLCGVGSYSQPTGSGERVVRNVRPFFKKENQGPVNSCQGHSLSTGVELLIWHQFGIVVQLSRMYAYLRTQEFSSGRTHRGGSIIPHGAKIAREEGLPAEKFFPYPGHWTGRIPQAARDNAHKFKVSETVRLKGADECLDWLGDETPGVIHFGMTWGGAMRQGRRRYESIPRSRGGNHAVLLSSNLGNGECELANSHSHRWGEDGCTELSYAALKDAWRLPYCEAIGLRGIDVESQEALKEARA